MIDGLTGLLNRRAVENLAQAEVKRQNRYGNPLTIGLFDVDHFKQVNTDYLLTGGDAALIGLAQVLSSSLQHGFAGRMGGEEFLVVARRDGQSGAMK